LMHNQNGCAGEDDNLFVAMEDDPSEEHGDDPERNNVQHDGNSERRQGHYIHTLAWTFCSNMTPKAA
jgi:hypothetical protein